MSAVTLAVTVGSTSARRSRRKVRRLCAGLPMELLVRWWTVGGAAGEQEEKSGEER